MFGVRVAVYSEYYWNYVHALCRQNVDFVILKRATYKSDCASKNKNGLPAVVRIRTV